MKCWVLLTGKSFTGQSWGACSLLEEGGSRASSFPPWCGGAVPLLYRFTNPRMWVQPFGCLWLWARPWQCTWWWKGWVNVPIHIGVRGKSRGSFFETPELVQNDVKEESRCTSFSFVPLTSTSACKQDSFWSSHQQSCTFPEMHSSFRSWVTEDSTWKMCFGLFPFISLMGSWPDMCHFQSFQHWLIKDLYKKVYFCQAHVATLRTVGSRYWQYSHSLLSGSAVW